MPKFLAFFGITKLVLSFKPIKKKLTHPNDQLSFAEVQNFSDKVLKIVNEDPKFIFTKMILLIADTDGTDNLTFQELSSLQDFFAKILFSMADILDILILPGPNLTAKFMLSYIKQ